MCACMLLVSRTMAEALSQAVKDLAMQLGYVDDTAALLTHMLVCMLVVYIVGSCILGEKGGGKWADHLQHGGH